MNDQEMNNFIDSLSKPVREFIFTGVWEERTTEIAKKYSLNDTQTNDLVDTVLFVLTGLESPDTLLETIIAELGISRLLAEQIMDDLEIRVFEYAVKSVEKKSEVESQKSIKLESDTEKKEGEKVDLEILPEIKPEILPEIEPSMLPAIEGGGVAHNVKREEKNPVPKVTSEQTSQPSEIIYKTVHEEKPISVPHYTETPAENKITSTPTTETKPVEPTPTPQPNTLEVGEPTKDAGLKPPEPVSPPVKKYVVDPYREPIE